MEEQIEYTYTSGNSREIEVNRINDFILQDNTHRPPDLNTLTSQQGAATRPRTQRVQLETFDSSQEDRRDEKLVFKYIQKNFYQELRDHIEATSHKYNIMEIFDLTGHSPLHFAAYKNHDASLEVLIDFILGKRKPSLTLEDKFERIEKLKQWVNLKSKGEEGFTALHFASFHGNMKIIRLLTKYGANEHARNRQEINLLHVAAQGDQPVSIYYFMNKGLNINTADLRKSTTLHWAAFAGAELALAYLVAWGANVNADDSKGLTPLHLAVKAAEDIKSTKSIRLLLLKGADRNAVDLLGKRPVDCLKDYKDYDKNPNSPFIKEVKKLLVTYFTSNLCRQLRIASFKTVQ